MWGVRLGGALRAGTTEAGCCAKQQWPTARRVVADVVGSGVVDVVGSGVVVDVVGSGVVEP